MKKEKPLGQRKGVKEAMDSIKEFCQTNKESVAVAESVSSGALQLLFSAEEEAGTFFEGGITVYSLNQKEAQLNIPKEITEPCLGVSKEIAEKLAYSICNLFKVEIGMGLTGFASPFPEKDVYDLYAYGAAVRNGELIFCEKITSEKDSPEAIREDYAKQMIIRFSDSLKNNIGEN